MKKLEGRGDNKYVNTFICDRQIFFRIKSTYFSNATCESDADCPGLIRPAEPDGASFTA